MAYRRRYSRKYGGRRRRTRTKRTTRKKYAGKNDNKVFNYRLIESTNIATPDAVDFFVFKSFALSQITDAANIGALKQLYDQYRINKVSVKITPLFNTQDFTQQTGMTKTAIDYNGVDSPSAADMDGYQTLVKTRATQVHKRTFVPKVATMIYNGALSTAYSTPNKQPWIDVQYDEVPHYGLLIDIDHLPEQILVYHSEVTYYVSFKNLR